MLRQILLVGMGGALGSIARFGVSLLVSPLWTRGFPLGTLFINVSGCLVMGALVPWLEGNPPMSSNWRVFLAVGILGGYTTFSAFGYEANRLFRSHEFGFAYIYLAASLILGLGAVWLGRSLVQWVR